MARTKGPRELGLVVIRIPVMVVGTSDTDRVQKAWEWIKRSNIAQILPASPHKDTWSLACLSGRLPPAYVRGFWRASMKAINGDGRTIRSWLADARKEHVKRVKASKAHEVAKAFTRPRV